MRLFSYILFSFFFLFSPLDIDECHRFGNKACIGDATCHNTEGSYKCTCQVGYDYQRVTGCVGESQVFTTCAVVLYCGKLVYIYYSVTQIGKIISFFHTFCSFFWYSLFYVSNYLFIHVFWCACIMQTLAMNEKIVQIRTKKNLMKNLSGVEIINIYQDRYDITISDVDECASHQGQCLGTAKCNNVPGSYICRCDSQFSYNDRVGCLGAWEQIQIIQWTDVSNIFFVKEMSRLRKMFIFIRLRERILYNFMT